MLRLDNEAFRAGKIVCVGRNYSEHVQELKNEIPENIVVFMKPSSCISEELHSKHLDESVHYEGEICFLIQSGCLKGVGFGLDLTKRELQAYLKQKGLPWERAKCFDGAAVFSDFVSFEEDVHKLSLQLYKDEVMIQEGSVTQMMYKPDAMIQEITSFSRLEDYDIIMSGTPKGVGVLEKGSRYKGKILYEGNILIEKEWMAK